MTYKYKLLSEVPLGGRIKVTLVFKGSGILGGYEVEGHVFAHYRGGALVDLIDPLRVLGQMFSRVAVPDQLVLVPDEEETQDDDFSPARAYQWISTLRIGGRADENSDA